MLFFSLILFKVYFPYSILYFKTLLFKYIKLIAILYSLLIIFYFLFSLLIIIYYWKKEENEIIIRRNKDKKLSKKIKNYFIRLKNIIKSKGLILYIEIYVRNTIIMISILLLFIFVNYIL